MKSFFAYLYSKKLFPHYVVVHKEAAAYVKIAAAG